MNNNITEISNGFDTYECIVDKNLAPTLVRLLSGSTNWDRTINALTIPIKPYWLKICVRCLRWYRKHISTQIRHRCVFDPSCSHFAELAFRKKGFFKGLELTIMRLFRCRPGNGGVDLP